MLHKLVTHLWESRRQFAKYFITGVSAFMLDIGTLYLLKEYAGLSAVVAVIINQLFLLNYVFFINKYWSFRAGGITHQQMIRFYLLAGFNYIFSVAWMWLVHDKAGLHYLLTRVINIILAISWNFLLYKHWIYKDVQQNVPSPPST